MKCPRSYNRGNYNPMYGRKHSPETIEKMRQVKLGVNNPVWKGDDVSYGALHDWVKDHLPKTQLCQICKEVSPFDLSNISGLYSRDLADWQWLCRSCHMYLDGRIHNLRNNKELE